jgi:hypothetical protein
VKARERPRQQKLNHLKLVLNPIDGFTEQKGQEGKKTKKVKAVSGI